LNIIKPSFYPWRIKKYLRTSCPVANLWLHLTLIDKTKLKTLSYLGQKIREIREKQNLLLRQVAAHIEVDTALMSKSERGERNLNREQVTKLAKYFKTSEEELISLWLCDKVIDAVGDDPFAEQGIKKALTKIKK
jgi:HTH-type transcriptional regulator, competence development regulator